MFKALPLSYSEGATDETGEMSGRRKRKSRNGKEAEAMKKFHGGHPVGRGAYGHVRDARMIALQDGEILPGERSAVYYRIPVVLVFPQKR